MAHLTSLAGNSVFQRLRYSVGFQLFSIVFTFYFILTLVITTIHMVLEFNQAEQEIVNALKNTGETFAPSLAYSLYHEDDIQVWSTLQGILKLPGLIAVHIITPYEEHIHAGQKINDPRITKGTSLNEDHTSMFNIFRGFLSYQYPIIYQEEDQIYDTGSLILYSNQQIVWEKVELTLMFIALTALVKTLILWWLFLIFSRKILSRPLDQLNRVTSQINFNNLNGEDIHIDSRNNELTQLQNTFNSMLHTLIQEKDEIHFLIAQVEEQNKELTRVGQLKDEFLTNISHELRTPMTGILGFAKRGIKNFETADKEKLFSYFIEIESSGKRLLKLLNDLLDLSKLEAGKMSYNKRTLSLLEPVELVVREVEAVLHEKSISCDIMPVSFDVTAYFDPEKIVQVLRNLVYNAIKFTPEGKQIRISFAEEQLIIGRRIQDCENVDAIKVSLWNEGSHIPPHELDTIFEKFTQSSATKTGSGGTGLGLPICKAILKEHQGKIWAENSSEGGVYFHFIVLKG